ncbi:uncharacterized protein LOC128846265 [Malaclemys terrapin pileata]|uniref:uncharacterized protein LOC128846265 n=1 Tax=Malaclemys terrapin pileata TaxID=2991368 RepID=UPI0023A904BF|nr:uncharacterized protein LOC128846265 [Malaclemys terrapin pileata]
MKTLLLSLLLFAIAAYFSVLFAGVHSQVKLLQTGAAQVKPSQTLRLTCSVSGFSLTSSGYGVSWVRQPPAKGLEWLSAVYWDEDKYYQESLKNGLTISRDTSKSEVYLEMRGMEARDSGTYYCARRHTLVQSSPGTMKPSESLHLTCTASGFSIASSGYTCHWIRRAPGKGLEWLGYVNVYYSTSGSISPPQSRISITQDTSKNELYLRLRSLTAADTAAYYCARHTMTRSEAGPGTKCQWAAVIEE